MSKGNHSIKPQVLKLWPLKWVLARYLILATLRSLSTPLRLPKTSRQSSMDFIPSNWTPTIHSRWKNCTPTFLTMPMGSTKLTLEKCVTNLLFRQYMNRMKVIYFKTIMDIIEALCGLILHSKYQAWGDQAPVVEHVDEAEKVLQFCPKPDPDLTQIWQKDRSPGNIQQGQASLGLN